MELLLLGVLLAAGAGAVYLLVRKGVKGAEATVVDEAKKVEGEVKDELKKL
jgi:hypothetical protein